MRDKIEGTALKKHYSIKGSERGITF